MCQRSSIRPGRSALSLGVALAVAGCNSFRAAEVAPYQPSTGENPGSPADGGAGDASAEPPPSGLPCAVQALLAQHCQSCHGPTPSGGAPMSLVTWADLAGPAKTQPKKSVAQLSVERMQDPRSPMPPLPGLPATGMEQTLFADWVALGLPKGTCQPGDAGVAGDLGAGAADLASSDLATPAQSGLPCDVAAILAGGCLSCHGSPPSGGAPMALVSWADLTAASPKGGTYASRALARMQDLVSPMPPAPGAPIAAPQMATFQAWVNGGEPKGACGPPDGGSGVDAAGPPHDLASTDLAKPAQNGLPCDVAAILGGGCLSCHGSPPSGGAPMALVTYADLTAASPKGGTYATRALARMQDLASPMPPAPGAPIAAPQIATFQAWVNGGEPKGACGPPDGGAVVDAAGPPPDLASTDLATPPQTGLPCDVAATLSSCLGCHGNPVSGGAPMPLVTYADLAAASPKGGTYASRALARMQDLASPMPPAPAAPVPAPQIASFQAWVNAALPMGNCGPILDGGIPNPYNTPNTCTSALYWAGGQEDWMGYPKAGMHPGLACLDCHTNPRKYGVQDNGPAMWIGGTVYPSAHEFDECFGVDGNKTPTTVQITDANKQVVTLHVGVTGDFYLRKGVNVPALVFPIYASVSRGGKTRAMSQSVPSGDCNTCHTLAGASNAPGRIMAP